MGYNFSSTCTASAHPGSSILLQFFFFSISRLAYFKARFIYPGIHLYHSWEHHSGWGVLCIDHGRRVFKHYFLFLVVCRGLADGTVSARFPCLRKGLQWSGESLLRSWSEKDRALRSGGEAGRRRNESGWMGEGIRKCRNISVPPCLKGNEMNGNLHPRHRSARDEVADGFKISST